MTSTQLLIGGQWTAARSGETEEVRSPFDGSVVGEVPTAGPEDVELALAAAERGAVTWRRTPAHERMRILLRAAALADERTAADRRDAQRRERQDDHRGDRRRRAARVT